jgi:hypothetical protein
MAEKPCNQCQHYDPINKGAKGGKHGWCAVRSEYPAQEQSGQVFPPGVKRVEEGALAKPHIVEGAKIVKNCQLFRALPVLKAKHK